MSMQVQRPASAVYGNGQAITEVRQELARRMAAWIEAADELRRHNPEGPVVIADNALRVELAAIAGELFSRTVRARQGEASPRQLTASAFDALLDSIGRLHLRAAFMQPLPNTETRLRRKVDEAVVDEVTTMSAQAAVGDLSLAADRLLCLPWRDARSALLAEAARLDAQIPATQEASREQP